MSEEYSENELVTISLERYEELRNQNDAENEELRDRADIAEQKLSEFQSVYTVKEIKVADGRDLYIEIDRGKLEARLRKDHEQTKAILRPRKTVKGIVYK